MPIVFFCYNNMNPFFYTKKQNRIIYIYQLYFFFFINEKIKGVKNNQLHNYLMITLKY